MKNPSIMVNFYYNSDYTKYRAIARAANNSMTKAEYSGVKNVEALIKDFQGLVMEKMNIDFMAPAEEFPESKPVFSPEPADEFDPDPVFAEPVHTETERVVTMKAPEADDGYEPVIVDADVRDEYDPIMATPDDYYDPYDPVYMGFEAASASDKVNTRLVADVQQREFQPMNSYPNFPFGDTADIRDTNLGWDARTGTAGPAEAVEVELLDEVKEREGMKHLIEKEETFGAKRSFQMPKIGPIAIAIGAGLLAYILFFRNKPQY